jgi:secondary thiamine-phosphate synthase enzyme
MKTELTTLTVQTNGPQEMLNLTSRFMEAVASSGIRNGLAGLFTQHTTAVVLVNEFQTALLDDIRDFLGRAVPDGVFYRHNSPELSDCDRHNAASHLRSLLFNNGVLVPVADGQLILGQFQSVILAELDGPRERTLKLQILGE